MKLPFFLFLLVTPVVFSQSTETDNSTLKNELSAAKSRYNTDLSVYNSEFEMLEKARQDYCSRSRSEFFGRPAALKKQVDELRRTMNFCDKYNLDYSKLVNIETLKKAESLNYQIDEKHERLILSEIVTFQQVKDTIAFEGLKPEAQNRSLKNQLDLYQKARNQNSMILLKQRQLISEVKKSSKELDSIRDVYNRQLSEVHTIFLEVGSLAFQKYMKEKKEGRGKMPYAVSYEQEFKKAPTETYFPEVPAEFPGGDLLLKQYISKHIQLPASVTEFGFEGNCYVAFTVKSSGEITNVIASNRVPYCPECLYEAERLIKEMPLWTPGKTKGVAMDTKATVTVEFTVKK